MSLIQEGSVLSKQKHPTSIVLSVSTKEEAQTTTLGSITRKRKPKPPNPAQADLCVGLESLKCNLNEGMEK